MVERSLCVHVVSRALFGVRFGGVTAVHKYGLATVDYIDELID